MSTLGVPVDLPRTPQSQVSSTETWSLRRIFRAYRWRILFTYGLFNLENLLRLAQPLALGWAVNDLLDGKYVGLFAFLAQHIAYMAIGTLRRAYDTRAFTSIYTDLTSKAVVKQRDHGVATSRVAARSALSRTFVDFFELDVPVVVQSLYSVVGALIMLAFFDWMIALFCLVLIGPGWILNKIYSRKTFIVNSRLHDELEREVAVIEGGKIDEVRGHYGAVGRWRVKLSDLEAWNFGLMELFILGLIGATLARTCALGLLPGDILTIFQFLMMFLIGVDSVPQLVQQFSRLREIGGRMRGDPQPQ